MPAKLSRPSKSDQVVRRPQVGSRLGQPSGPCLSLPELAAELRISTKTALRLIHVGQFPPFAKVGRAFVFRRTAVEDWLRSRESATGITPRKRKRRAKAAR